VGLTAADLAAAPAGTAVLLHVRGIIDSGTTITAVTPRILARLNVPRGPVVGTTTATGIVQVHLYQISFTIYGKRKRKEKGT